MSHQSDQSDDDVAELLGADRELTPDEQSRLRRIGETSWQALRSLLDVRAMATYRLAQRDDFNECVFEHMLGPDRDAMVMAEVYFCPECDRLLKDRKTPVASAILLERGRVRQLWLRVEQSPPEMMDAALERFRRALGLRST